MTNEERLAKLEKLQAEIKEATKREAKEIKEIMKADKADQFFYLMQGCFPKLGKDAILYYKKEENIIIPATEIEVDKIAAAGGARVEIIFPFFLENQKAVIKLLENSYNIYSVTVKPSKIVNWKFSTIFASALALPVLAQVSNISIDTKGHICATDGGSIWYANDPASFWISIAPPMGGKCTWINYIAPKTLAACVEKDGEGAAPQEA